MKKILFAAVMTTILVGCTKNETGSPLSSREIKFTNLNDKVNTKAANDASDNYQVYAKWTGGTTSWFINDVINGAGGNVNKPQSNVYHWPANGTVDFYSWAPASVTATATYPNISIAYTVPANADQDFTIAAPKTGMSTGTVAFLFSHMLAKVSISVDLDQTLKDGGYSVTFTGGTATLGVRSTSATIDPTSATPTWTGANTTTASYTGATSYMIMPQTSTGCTVQVNGGVTLTKGGATLFTGGLSKYTIATGDVPSNLFEKGKHYLLKMIISSSSTDNNGDPILGDEILFSASIAADWTVVTPDPTLPQP